MPDTLCSDYLGGVKMFSKYRKMLNGGRQKSKTSRRVQESVCRQQDESERLATAGL
jgi:hypothetical protein